jgi:hypothetical protein
MKKLRIIDIIGIIAGLIFLNGVFIAAVTILQYPNLKQQRDNKLKSMQKLTKLEQDYKQLQLQIDPLTKIDYKKQPDPEKLIRSIFPPASIERIDQQTKNVNRDFSIIQIDLSLKNIELSQLQAFIRTMESLRPPIKLISCKISASHRPGIGNVNLTLETVSRPE